MEDIPTQLKRIRGREGLSQEGLARVLGVSYVSLNRWERGVSEPSPLQAARIRLLTEANGEVDGADMHQAFASRGIRNRTSRQLRSQPQLFEEPMPEITLSTQPLAPMLDRISPGRVFSSAGGGAIADILAQREAPATTTSEPPSAGMSAGKNTYTYDAHTYHTKVPPQGIAELLKHYLPEGGLVFDPFAGSGMTGVAAQVLGYDSVLNELSPAACFIANRFVTRLQPEQFRAGVKRVLDELASIRRALYTTHCRECGQDTEILYTVWSYNVICPFCEKEFLLWDACRRYGRTVREHKILSEFACPACSRVLRKSRLKRTIAEPVFLGYICCGSRQQEAMHQLNKDDLETNYRLEVSPPLAKGYFPTTPLPEGVNLNQPRKHGIVSVDRFYTPRNLAAMSHLWQTIHRITEPNLAAHLAFVLTSLYQRVTRLSEFRFWGGSGNTARFNVPFIFNEANVFRTFERKARTIQDHLETTASHYSGSAVVVQGSATRISYLPDESVDLVFTDPPFGGNINYSEMNILWESWLGRFTDATEEAIINRVQDKDVTDYQALILDSLRECNRVLRPGRWMLLMFMNSSARVWDALRAAVLDAGFSIEQVDIFDKTHGTFKQFVSQNTPGADLVLHCQKREGPTTARTPQHNNQGRTFAGFLEGLDPAHYQATFLHVDREPEINYRRLYSEWLSTCLQDGLEAMSFPEFRKVVGEWFTGKENP